MSEFRADLHCHSTFSDGSMSVEQLIDYASTQGLSGLSVTDHDTIAAYPMVQELGCQKNIAVIPGVEFSTHVHSHAVHILGYAFDIRNEGILAFCQAHQKRREERNRAILDRLKALKMPIFPQDFPITHGSIGRPHIAAAMMKRGYVESIQSAFRLYLREGAPGYVPGPRFSVEETIEVIHKAKGLVIIAHPHLVGDEMTIQHLLKLPFDGIEVFYARFNADKCRRWHEIALKKEWLITGGSDFHGDAKPSIALGSSWAPETSFNALITHYKGHSLD